MRSRRSRAAKGVLLANENTFWHALHVTKFVFARLAVCVKSFKKPANALAQQGRKCINKVDIWDRARPSFSAEKSGFCSAATGRSRKASNLLKSWQPQPD